MQILRTPLGDGTTRYSLRFTIAGGTRVEMRTPEGDVRTSWTEDGPDACGHFVGCSDDREDLKVVVLGTLIDI